MYLAAFVQVWLLGRYRARNRITPGWTSKDVEDLMFYGVLGVIVGGRLGEALLYHPRVLPVESARDSRRLERRDVLPRRIRRRAHCDVDLGKAARPAVSRGRRFHRATGPARLRIRTHRQFHQRRVDRPPDRRAVGRGVPECRHARATPVAAVSRRARRSAAVRHPVVVHGKAAADRRAVRGVPDRLRPGAEFRGVFPDAGFRRQLAWGRHHVGPAVQHPDGRRGDLDVGWAHRNDAHREAVR